MQSIVYSEINYNTHSYTQSFYSSADSVMKVQANQTARDEVIIINPGYAMHHRVSSSLLSLHFYHWTCTWMEY